jgi:membrane protein YdbS with pleckstrin-like domain
MMDGAGDVAEAGRESFHPVEPGYKTVLRARMLALWGPLTIGAFVLERSIVLPWPGALFGIVVFLAIVAVIVAPQRIYARLGYRVGDRLLQVVHGWAFHTDTVVPFVRVQHLDVTRGPLDKMFGTASLIIHTAGTHNSIVTVPGLAPDRAAEIRDLIRQHVRTDFQ